jgi:2-amino-4-hydroxy-6-hydroxymethyldihydropteridine diphosphokinase
MKKIFLLLGSNLGELKENLECAVKNMESRRIKILKKSKIYRTKPWGVSEQPDFLNQALEVETEHSAAELLKVLKEIEGQMGREDGRGRWGPRVIDIDIIFMDGLIIDREDLKIPHRHFFERAFAIKILSEIAPDFHPPGSARALIDYARGEDNEGIQVYCD